jgi:hypothetical protein
MRVEPNRSLEGVAEQAVPAGDATRRERSTVNKLHSAPRANRDYLGIRTPRPPWALRIPGEWGSREERARQRRAEPVDPAAILKAVNDTLQGLDPWREQRDERIAAIQQHADRQREEHLAQLDRVREGRGIQKSRPGPWDHDLTGRQLEYQHQLAAEAAAKEGEGQQEK